jgi:hypothetical protein
MRGQGANVKVNVVAAQMVQSATRGTGLRNAADAKPGR